MSTRQATIFGCAAIGVVFVVGLATTYTSNRNSDSIDLTTLATRAELAGWRVVPAVRGAAFGFYAVPPNDSRSDPEELIKLIPGRYESWGGIVRCSPSGEGDAPPCYRSPTFIIHGESDACRVFTDAVGID